jgi:hypothetical protein
MTKFTALILWPVVYVLDVGIVLIGAQTFKESRAVSKAHLKRILNQNSPNSDGHQSAASADNDSPGHTSMRNVI